MAFVPAQFNDIDATEKGSPGAFFVLLLNSETKGEEEEYLDYSFPADDKELQGLLRMKGVLLACCGVMLSTVGGEISFFLFRSMSDASLHYKACFHKIESWYLCIVLPGAVSDALGSRVLEEVCSLILLKHGRLASLLGRFEQLDGLFRGLAGLWSRLCSVTIADNDCEERRVELGAPGLFLALGVTLHGSMVTRGCSWNLVDVQTSTSMWLRRWMASTSTGGFVRPTGFALLLGPEHAVVATNLDDTSFDAALRLCLIDSRGQDIGGEESLSDDNEARCHSVFLHYNQHVPVEALLPSHQYSLLRRGPWRLFALWEMTQTCDKKGDEVASSSADPFGIDSCFEFLESLPELDFPTSNSSTSKQPPIERRHSDTQGLLNIDIPNRGSRQLDTYRAASPTSPMGHPSLHSPIKVKKSSSFGLPCWGKSIKSKPSKGCKTDYATQTRVRSAIQRPRGIFLRALQAQTLRNRRSWEATAAENGVSNGAEVVLTEPCRVARGDLEVGDLKRMICPELASKAFVRKPSGYHTLGTLELVEEWSELEFLVSAHNARKPAWKLLPRHSLRKHVLLDVLKSENTIDRLWAECSQSLCKGDDSAVVVVQTTKLGAADRWRFQVESPYPLSDMSQLVSIGTRTGCGQSRAWTAVSAIRDATERVDEKSRRRRKDLIFFQLDAMGEAA